MHKAKKNIKKYEVKVEKYERKLGIGQQEEESERSWHDSEHMDSYPTTTNMSSKGFSGQIFYQTTK